MSKLTGSSVLKLVKPKRTALYNATGRRYGSIRYRGTQSKSPRHQSIAKLLWYALNTFQKRK